MTVKKVRISSIISSSRGKATLAIDEIDETLVGTLKEVYEETIVPGTDNIIMKVKKYILPIENLKDTTYTVE